MRTALLSTAVLSALSLSACVIAPLPPPPPPHAEYVAPAGVVYVAPTYAMPAHGYVWEYHARYGWGWRHPHHGWHRGW